MQFCTEILIQCEGAFWKYPDVAHIYNKPLEWFCERIILTPKNDQAEFINDTILLSFEVEEKTYNSIDSVITADNR